MLLWTIFMVNQHSLKCSSGVDSQSLAAGSIYKLLGYTESGELGDFGYLIILHDSIFIASDSIFSYSYFLTRLDFGAHNEHWYFENFVDDDIRRKYKNCTFEFPKVFCSVFSQDKTSKYEYHILVSLLVQYGVDFPRINTLDIYFDALSGELFCKASFIPEFTRRFPWLCDLNNLEPHCEDKD
jgi:hypothetical protein